jgi:phosphoglycolate phosphatase-like HAD superfamily hydrolase
MTKRSTGVDTAAQHSPLQPVFPWVVFDMDGTLVDTFQLNLRSFNYAVKRTLTTEEVLGIPGGTLEEELANHMPLADVSRAIERYHAHYRPILGGSPQLF